MAAFLLGTASPVSSAADGGGLKERCAADIFKQPQILNSEMRLAGKKAQSIFIKLGFAAVDPTCDGHFLRMASVLPQLVRHGQVINENPSWMPILTRKNGNEKTKDSLLDFNSANQPQRYWRPGDKAQFRLRIQELNLAGNKIVKASIKTFPIKVKRK